MDCFTEKCKVTTIIRSTWYSKPGYDEKAAHIFQGKIIVFLEETCTSATGCFDTLWCVLFAPCEQVAFCPGESIF